MNTIAALTPRAKTPVWFWGAGLAGTAWNLYGIKQFLGSVSASRDHMMSMGMTSAQAEVYAGLPLWMTLVFAIGVGGGLAGSLLMLARSRFALPVFSVSLAGYVALYSGDIALGVFAAFGFAQVAVLTAVVVIAAALLWSAIHGRRQGMLR